MPLRFAGARVNNIIITASWLLSPSYMHNAVRRISYHSIHRGTRLQRRRTCVYIVLLYTDRWRRGVLHTTSVVQRIRLCAVDSDRCRGRVARVGEKTRRRDVRRAAVPRVVARCLTVLPNYGSRIISEPPRLRTPPPPQFITQQNSIVTANNPA